MIISKNNMNKLCSSPDYEHKQRTPLDTIRFQTRNSCEKRKEGFLLGGLIQRLVSKLNHGRSQETSKKWFLKHMGVRERDVSARVGGRPRLRELLLLELGLGPLLPLLLDCLQPEMHLNRARLDDGGGANAPLRTFVYVKAGAKEGAAVIGRGRDALR